MGIPNKIKKQLILDPFFAKCMLTGVSNKQAKIDWHHAFQYKSKNGWQIQEKWAIAPIQQRLHSPYGDPKAVHRCQNTKEWVMLLLLRRADLELIQKKYPRKNWKGLKNFLENKFDNYTFTMEKKEKKPSKFKICKKCKQKTMLMICENCGNPVYKQDKK